MTGIWYDDYSRVVPGDQWTAFRVGGSETAQTAEDRHLPRITRVVVNNTTKTVYVQMTVDVSPLFPEFLQVSSNSAWGEAGSHRRRSGRADGS